MVAASNSAPRGTRRSSRLLKLALASCVALLLAATTPTASAAAKGGLCSATNKCPASAPCCSSAGYCGSSAAYCLAGCNPLGSLSPSSCAAMPVCKTQTIDFTSSSSRNWVGLSAYNGDPTVAPFTLDSGDVKSTSEGVVLLLNKKNQDVGTVLSTTRYMYYGSVTATLKHPNHDGIVAAFILMSPTADEIDYELTTSGKSHVETNAFYRGGKGDDNDSNGKTLSVKNGALPSGFDTSKFHRYTVKWTKTSITWLVDDKVVRTFPRSSRRVKSHYNYPATPSRIQLSVWCAGCPENAPGTRAWSGGKPDWSKVDDVATKSFTVTIKSLEISCDTPSDVAGYPALSYSSKTDADSAEPRIVGTHRQTTL